MSLLGEKQFKEENKKKAAVIHLKVLTTAPKALTDSALQSRQAMKKASQGSVQYPGNVL